MTTFKDVLGRAGIDPREVNVILHMPAEAGFADALAAGLLSTRPEAFECYQRFHRMRAAATLSGGRPLVASFVRTGFDPAARRTRLRFVGLYDNPGPRQRPRAEFEADPEVRWLHDAFGVFAAELAPGQRGDLDWFDLTLSERLRNVRRRLVVDMPFGRSYVRLAENFDAEVHEVSAEGGDLPRDGGAS